MDFIELAVGQGYNRGLVQDFLEQLGYGQWSNITEPTLEWLAQYKEDVDSAYASQAAWDASCGQEPVNPGGYQRTIWGV